MSLKVKLKEIAGWFQPMYDKIYDWDLPWLRELCGALWMVLGKDMKKYIYALIITINKEYGQVKAKEIMEVIKKKLDD